MAEDIPVEQVRIMKAQGISDDKIVETLQRDGFKSSQIFDAITQAEMKPADEVRQVTDDFPDLAQNIQGPPMQNTPNYPEMPSGTDTENIQEIVESVIDEMWSELERDVQKIVDWKNSTEKKIDSMQEEMSMLKKQFERLQEALLGKIGEYDKNILNVGAEIKALEKAFSNIIPEFANSVSQLTDLVEDLKKDKAKKKTKKS